MVYLVPMRDSNRSSHGRGSHSFGPRSFGPREMFKATCSTCGRPCEVPFRPRGPVECSDCFEKSGNGERSDRRPSRFDDRRSNREDRPMFDAVCSSCGNPCKLPFEPRTAKPVYCSKCFDKPHDDDARRPDNFRAEKSQKTITSEQFEQLNAKMDKLLKLFTKLQISLDDQATAEDLVGDPPPAE